MNLKLYGILAVVLTVVGFLGYKAYQVSKLEKEIGQWRAKYEEAVKENQKQSEILKKLEKEAREAKQRAAKAERRVIELNKRLYSAHAEVDRLSKLFEDHDFAELVKKKPGLITRRIRSATKRVFDSFQEFASKESSRSSDKSKD
jgi:septal ring factor EnvC (AmiA/AmiB activator)